MAPVIVQQPGRLVRQNDDVVFRPNLQVRVADRTSAISQNVKFRDEASRDPFGAIQMDSEVEATIIQDIS